MFVRAPNPIWFMVDLVGLPLNDQYYALFLTNVFPYMTQNVYRDPQGMTIWTGNTVRFLPNGTLPDNLYFDPSLVYRIEIRQGPNQSDPLIYEIDNFVPCCGSSGGGGNNSNSFSNSENQITNSQFSFINFVSPYTITTSGTYNIAPGWQLVLTGSGTTTLTQLDFSGTGAIPTNPPFALRFNNNGWTSANLIQTFNHNGSIWNGGAISGSVLAESQVSIQNLSMNYVPSDGGTAIQIFNNAPLQVGVFQTIGATVAIPSPSNNSDTSSNAFVNIVIALPPTGIVDISNIQILGQTIPLVGSGPYPVPPYQQITQERSSDYLFHYYSDQLITKPKKSIINAWNFALNPWQFNDPAISPTATITSYVCDQTILRQESASSLLIGKSALFHRSCLEFFAIAGKPNNRWAIIQYIDAKTIAPYWGYFLSSLVRARLFQTAPNTNDVRVKMRLIWQPNVPPTIGSLEPITGWDVNGDVTFDPAWNVIKPQNDPAYKLPKTNIPGEGDNAYPAFAYNGFSLPVMSNANQTLGIVFYSMDDMAIAGTIDAVIFDKISLVPNLFAVETPPATFDEVLRECEYYFEKSYDQGLLPGDTTEFGAQIAQQAGITNTGNAAFQARSWQILFKNVKRSIPTVTFYSPISGTSGNIRGYVRNNGGDAGAPFNAELTVSTDWQIFPQKSLNSISLIPITAAALITSSSAVNNPDAFLTYQYTADSRLGI